MRAETITAVELDAEIVRLKEWSDGEKLFGNLTEGDPMSKFAARSEARLLDGHVLPTLERASSTVRLLQEENERLRKESKTFELALSIAADGGRTPERMREWLEMAVEQTEEATLSTQVKEEPIPSDYALIDKSLNQFGEPKK